MSSETDRLFAELAKVVNDHYNFSRERSLALTKLDEAQMWLERAVQTSAGNKSSFRGGKVLDDWTRGKIAETDDLFQPVPSSVTEGLMRDVAEARHVSEDTEKIVKNPSIPVDGPAGGDRFA